MFDFVGKRKVFYGISIAIIVIILAVALIFNVKMDISFVGGSITTYGFTGQLDMEEFQRVVEDQIDQEIIVQEQQDFATGAIRYVVSTTQNNSLDSDEQAALNQRLAEVFPDNAVTAESTSNVDATMGREFLLKCIVAIAVAAVFMIVYVAFRFRGIGGWSAGVMAVIALLHDVFIVFGAFVVFRFSLNDNFVAAVLTILGFSLNDSIVIYDRIRENKKILGKSVSTAELVNKSINQSLTRAINTTVAAVLALLVVCVVAYIYNVESIITFAVPLILGVISGVYTSVCLVGPMWVQWQEYQERKRPSHGKKKRA